jgi:hypothetical protein
MDPAVLFGFEFNKSCGTCSIELTHNAFEISPSGSEKFSVYMNRITGSRLHNEKLYIITEDGNKLVLSAEARVVTGLAAVYKKADFDLTEAQADALAALLPGLKKTTAEKASGIMKGGRAAMKQELDPIDPAIWSAVIDRIKEMPNGYSFYFLKAKAHEQEIAVGINGGTIWMMAPLCLGNAHAVALEFYGGSQKENFTHFFKIPHHGHSSIKFIGLMNRVMTAVNFEPGAIMQYSAGGEMKELRDLFLGSAKHTNMPDWKKRTEEILTEANGK